MKSELVRQLWSQFWESPEQWHKLVSPSSLVPDSQDKTVIFNTAGMQQLVPYLTGKSHSLGKRIYNIQRCVRTNDIDDIGDERHLSMFEMMGNWSLWDYFKKESLTWSIRFLTEVIGIDISRIGATIFVGKNWIPKDLEAKNILLTLGIPEERIKELDEDNFWGPAGTIGPCGPCSEIYVDRWDDYGPNDRNLWVNDRFIEVWNNVFMEYYKDEKGVYTKLSQQNVDTGMGFERLMMIIQWKETIFETDIFEGIIKTIEEFFGNVYPPYNTLENNFSSEQKTLTRSFRIITDHVRSSVFLMADGVIPSNEGRGYVLRRLIRRMYYHMIKINKNSYLSWDAVAQCIELLVGNIALKYSTAYSHIDYNKTHITYGLITEIWQFQEALKRWEKVLEEIVKTQQTKIISGTNAFLLYDTYGFPIELTQEVAINFWFTVDLNWFSQELEIAKDKSRKSSSQMFKKSLDWAKYLEWIPQTKFLWYIDVTLVKFSLLKEIDLEWAKVLVFDSTPFYAESGGQTSDKGSIELDDGRIFEVVDVQKYAWVFLHFVK